MIRKFILLCAALSVAVAACATPPPEKPMDKEGVRHRADDSKKKLAY
ncbi:MAG: hypothetical protein HZA04_08280 [Nitrospinae bacterium]|nr:hypothetical protein [Nitrospinota bacterium]